jgi:hypothetical protein
MVGKKDKSRVESAAPGTAGTFESKTLPIKTVSHENSLCLKILA